VVKNRQNVMYFFGVVCIEIHNFLENKMAQNRQNVVYFIGVVHIEIHNILAKNGQNGKKMFVTLIPAGLEPVYSDLPVSKGCTTTF
jgi:hypothetical protein